MCGTVRRVDCTIPPEMRRGAISGVVAIERGVCVAKGREILVGVLETRDGEEDPSIAFVSVGWRVPHRIDELRVFSDEQFFLVRCGMNQQHVVEVDTAHVDPFQTDLAGTTPRVTACSPQQPKVHAGFAGDGMVRLFDVRQPREGPPSWTSAPIPLSEWATDPILSFVGAHGIGLGFTTRLGRAANVVGLDTRMGPAPTSRCAAGMSSVRPRMAFTDDGVVVMYTPDAVGVATGLFFNEGARFDATCLAPPPNPQGMGAVDRDEYYDDCHFLDALCADGMVVAVSAGTVYTFLVDAGLPFEGPSPPDAPMPVEAAVLGKHKHNRADGGEEEAPSKR